jgi:hypothetical protein
LGKCLGPALIACLLSTGCSLFQHDQPNTAQKMLDEPITDQRHQQAVAQQAQQKPSWFQSWFGPPDPPKAKTMSDWVGQPRVN